MTALDIIQLFGGVTKLSVRLGIPLTTVSSWGRSNHIPDWRRAKLLEFAATDGVNLSATDFPERERVA